MKKKPTFTVEQLRGSPDIQEYLEAVKGNLESIGWMTWWARLTGRKPAEMPPNTDFKPLVLHILWVAMEITKFLGSLAPAQKPRRKKK